MMVRLSGTSYFFPNRKTCTICSIAFLLSNSPLRNDLVEFRPAGRNKMEIHCIRRLCRPEQDSRWQLCCLTDVACPLRVQYFSLSQCRILSLRDKILRAVEAHPLWQKAPAFCQFSTHPEVHPADQTGRPVRPCRRICFRCCTCRTFRARTSFSAPSSYTPARAQSPAPSEPRG